MKDFLFSDKPNTPSGIATLLPADAYRHRFIERTLLELFSKWGYQEIIPPLFEYLDVIRDVLDAGTLEASYQFPDRETGRMMLLRPDVTPQIARIASLLLGEHKPPIRLCYSSNIFRHESNYIGKDRETFQIGAELIGLDTHLADAELIELGMEALISMGIKNFRVALGHVGFLKSILDMESFPGRKRAVIAAILLKRDTSMLNAENDLLTSKEREKIEKLLDIFGTSDQLKKAENLIENKQGEESLGRLIDIFDLLSRYEENLIIDLGEMRGFNYYTGVIFEFFTAGSGLELGGGGRYDRLLETFGRGFPSSGFAFNIERIEKVLELGGVVPEMSSADIVFVFSKHEAVHCGTMIRQIRDAGARVVQMPVSSVLTPEGIETGQDPAYKESLEFAADYNIKKIIFHASSGEIFQWKEGALIRLSLEDVLTGIG